MCLFVNSHQIFRYEKKAQSYLFHPTDDDDDI